MNENHTHDKELLEKVEQRLENGQSSGSRLLDDLASMRPQAKADFQQELENRLLASFYKRQLETKENPELSTLTLKSDTKSRKITSLPLTLAAAITAVLLIGSALLTGGFPGSFLSGGSIAQSVTFTPTAQPTTTSADDLYATATAVIVGATQTAEAASLGLVNDMQLTATAVIAGATQTVAALTATPLPTISGSGDVELQPVVIALQDIGESSTLTADMLAVAYYPLDIVPLGVVSDPASAIGMVVNEPIARYQPVLTSNLIQGSPLPDISAVIPEGMVAVSIPVSMLSTAAFAIHEGDNLNLVLPSETIEGVQVIYIGTMDTTDMIVFAMSAADAALLTSMLETSPSLAVEIERQNTADTPVIFEYGGHVTDTNTNAAPLMLQAGMTWMKLQVDYTPGMGTAPIALAINHAHAYGFNILLTIVGSPTDMSAAGYIEQYAAFLGEVATLNPDAIEVWNEPNLDRTWPTGQIGGAAYADMLRQAYQAIKNANSEVMVISAAPAPTGAEAAYPNQVMNDDRWIQELVDAGGLDYMDCLGAHYVEGTVSPTQISGDARDDYYTRYLGTMLLTYSNLSSNIRPICFTEFGYLSDDGYPALNSYFAWAQNTTIDQQAVWLAQAAGFARASEQVRLMIIWNVDFTTYNANDPTAGYAIIRADGSCPACVALAGGTANVARVTVNIPNDTAAVLWTQSEYVDVVAPLLYVDLTIDGISFEFQQLSDGAGDNLPRLVTQRVLSDVPILFHEDGMFDLILPPQDAIIIQWMMEAQIPLFILPHVTDNATQPVVSESLSANHFAVTIMQQYIDTSSLELQVGDRFNATILMGENESQLVYTIEDIELLADNGANGLQFSVANPTDAGLLSWVEQGGFTVTLSEAQP
ncbi:MAG: SAF domain-containing protein [Anaerolineae bacterium]